MERKPKSLRSQAIRCLSRREYSRAELAQRLRSVSDNLAEVEGLLDELIQQGWLSDRRYAEQLAHARQEKYSAQRIAHELREKGVATELATDLLSQLKAGDFERALKLWQKKFGQSPQDQQERAKQVRFLQNRGFSLEIIMKVLRASTALK